MTNKEKNVVDGQGLATKQEKTLLCTINDEISVYSYTVSTGKKTLVASDFSLYDIPGSISDELLIYTFNFCWDLYKRVSNTYGVVFISWGKINFLVETANDVM